MRGAVFLDRDGTLVEDPGYLHDTGRVRLLPHVAEGLGALVGAGWPLVIISNQSGIARGLYGPEAFFATVRRIEELLAPHGVRFLAAYFCPHHPDITGQCDCRKPGVELFRRAAKDHGLDLGKSWFIGDRLRDVLPAKALGGKGLLLRNPAHADEAPEAEAMGIPEVPDLAGAAPRVGANRG